MCGTNENQSLPIDQLNRNIKIEIRPISNKERIDKEKIKKVIESMDYKNNVSIYPKELPFQNTDCNIMNAANLFNEVFDQFIIDPCQFLKDFRYNMDYYFYKEHSELKEEYQELLNTNKSNGKYLKWSVLFIEPNSNLKLHIHPNIEYAYAPLKEYLLSEYRYKYIVQDISTIKNIPREDFIYNTPNFLINPIDSMHITYTKNNYAVILVLWSGTLIDVPNEDYPLFIQDLVPYSFYSALGLNLILHQETNNQKQN
jgi:hypothetical protein